MRAPALFAAARRPPQPLLLALSACAWLAAAAGPHAQMAPQMVCGSEASAPASLALAILLARPPLVPWLLMLVAMMLPLLARPLTHIWVRSLALRRWQALAVFLVGYALVWTAAGAVLTVVAVLMRASVAPLAAFGVAFVMACAWRSSPAWQTCQNRCHRAPRLAAFGLSADRDSFVYGASAAIWCIGTCWLLMLLPLLAGSAHLPVMLGAAFIAFVERQAPPRPVRWPVWPQARRVANGTMRGLAIPISNR